MKSKNIVIAFVLLVFGIGVSAYLTLHHYEVLYGLADSKSVCNVNETLDCDAVNSSSYSEFLGVPVAIIGGFVFLVQLLLLFGIKAFAEDEKKILKRFFFYISSANVVVTVFLAFVQTFILKTYCLFCLSLYVVTLGVFLCSLPDRGFSQLKNDILGLFRSGEAQGHRGILFTLLIIPIGSVLGHAMVKQGLTNGADINRMVNNSVAEWHLNSKYDFVTDTAPKFGSENPKLELVEFYDYQCGHCKKARLSLHTFVKSQKDKVRIVFQNYPLSSDCNPSMKSKGHGKSCEMAKAAICAHKAGKFMEAHDWIMEHQEKLNDASLTEMSAQLGLDKSSLEACMSDTETAAELAKQVERGTLSGVQGTPAIFANGKLLPGGFLIPVLNAALKTVD